MGTQLVIEDFKLTPVHSVSWTLAMFTDSIDYSRMDYEAVNLPLVNEIDTIEVQ